MTLLLHPAASHQAPFFITAPGQTDVLSVATAVVLIGTLFGAGVFLLRLHTLPERIAHKRQKIQFDIVAVLGLLALFTHIHLFWVAGLLLALIEIPSFSSPLGRIAAALERMSGRAAPTATPVPDDPPPAGGLDGGTA